MPLPARGGLLLRATNLDADAFVHRLDALEGLFQTSLLLLLENFRLFAAVRHKQGRSSDLRRGGDTRCGTTL